MNQTAAATADRDPLRLLSQAEVATLLLIDERTLREARHLGDAPPSIMVGRRLRWRRCDIEKWLMTRRTS
ncbi:MAG: helix-turn-helix domain-containing protein [Planctomycetes bacterium]|nr:helix-turn-helix domain-containing protein [Planctomycetota bacterium]